MAYPALPDRRMPVDNDGTVVAYGAQSDGAQAVDFDQGLTGYLSGAQRIEWNDDDWVDPGVSQWQLGATSGDRWMYAWLFFPEKREVTGLFLGGTTTGGGSFYSATVVQGSNDTTNGVDGTWETATLGEPTGMKTLDRWRKEIEAVSFTGGKTVVRIATKGHAWGSGVGVNWVLAHVYGEKSAGETPDDILFLDGENSYAEFTIPEDFGDRPLGTTITRTFKVKNASTTKTASALSLQCNDNDFAISTNGTTWVATIDISSLAPEASSSVLYVRDTTPEPGAILGPRFARIVATVGSWS